MNSNKQELEVHLKALNKALEVLKVFTINSKVVLKEVKVRLEISSKNSRECSVAVAKEEAVAEEKHR